ETVMQKSKTGLGVDDERTQTSIDILINYYVDIGWCDKAEALLVSIQNGGASRPANVNQKKSAREKTHRDRIQGLKPTPTKYQKELVAKTVDHPDALAARQALAVALGIQRRTYAAAYHLTAVLRARERVLAADHPDTHMCRFELGTIRLQQKKLADAEPLLL